MARNAFAAGAGSFYLLVAAYDGDFRGLPIAFLCGFVAWGVSVAIKRRSSRHLADKSSNIVVSAVIGYLVLAAIGRLTVLVCREVAGMDFGHAKDDSYFFSRALSLAAGDIPDQITPFDLLGGGVAAISNVLQGDTQLLDLLPVVWMLGALSVAISTAIAEQISQRTANAVALLSILANAVFIDTCTHYYRDAAMLVCLGSCFLFSLNRRWLLGTGAALLAWWIRVANGMIGLLGVFLFSFAQSRFAQRRPRLVTTICAIACALAVAVSSGSFGLGEDVSIAAKGAERREELRDYHRESAGRSLTARLYYAGPAGMVMAGAAAVFAPVTFRPAVQNVVYDTIFELRPTRGLFLFSLLEWLTIVLWPAVGPPLLVGCRSAIKGTRSQQVLLTLFLVTIIGNITISLQPRHRCSFIVMFPALVSLANRQVDGRALRLLAIAFVVLIGLLNFLQAIYLS